MKIQRSDRDLRTQIETHSHVLAASLALCASAFAQTATRVPQPIAPFSDVKTVATPVVKTEATPVVKTEATANAAIKPAAAPRAPHHPAADRSHVIYGDESSGAVWARGATYKAGFSSDGATYIPFLGARAPANHPVVLTVDRASIGGSPLAFERSVPAQRTSDSVRFERGAFSEVYDLAPSSVEQKFVFETFPGQGDLELVIRAASDMTRSVDADGLALSNALGRVRYGRAEVVDSVGRRAPATTEWLCDEIRIEVASSFLAGASFPVTIDPLITTFTVDNSPYDDFAPDVAFDAGNGIWAIMYEETFSAADHDVIAVLADTDGLTVPFGLFYVDNTPEDWRHPRVADNALADQFLIAAQVAGGAGHTIRGRMLPAGAPFGGSLGPKFTIADEGQYDVLNPDVGGDPSGTSPSYFCVVWERVFDAGDHDIHARLVSANATLSPIINVDNSGLTLDTNPAISKSDGMPPYDSEMWTIVWERLIQPGDHDVLGSQMRWDGYMTTSTFPMLITSADETQPRVSSLLDGGLSPRPYLVVCSMAYPFADHDIVGALFQGANQLDSKNLSELDAFPTWSHEQIQPTVDTDGHQFVVAYSEQAAPGSDYDTFLTAFNSAGNVIGLTEPRVQLTNATHDDEPSIAAAHSGGASDDRFMALWCVHKAGGDDDIAGAIYQIPHGGPVSGLCFGTNATCPCMNGGSPTNGCANSQVAQGAHLDATGVARVSADTLVLQASQMPSPSTCLYFQGSGTNPHAVGDGWMCAGGGLIRLGVKANVNGASTFGGGGDPLVSVKGAVPAVGGTRYYQVWYRDNHPFCMAETYNFTNAVSVVWVP
jgi:hypothetical protein